MAPSEKTAAARVWAAINREIAEQVKHEPLLASFLYETVLYHKTLSEGLGFLLSNKLDSSQLRATLIRELFQAAHAADPAMVEMAAADLEAVVNRDPAAAGLHSIPFLYFKGFQALQCHRVAHWLWQSGRKTMAIFFQNRISELYAVDIHPAARIGCGILCDHATSLVIGETAVVENNVSILHEVTLGGTGKEQGDRHPKVREGVLIGAGAKILGNIEIGKGAKIGAGSVVLNAVPAHATVVGVPAKVVGTTGATDPALDMDQIIPIPDDYIFII